MEVNTELQASANLTERKLGLVPTRWEIGLYSVKFRLDAVENRKISDRHRNPVAQLVVQPLCLLSYPGWIIRDQ